MLLPYSLLKNAKFIHVHQYSRPQQISTLTVAIGLNPSHFQPTRRRCTDHWGEEEGGLLAAATTKRRRLPWWQLRKAQGLQPRVGLDGQ